MHHVKSFSVSASSWNISIMAVKQKSLHSRNGLLGLKSVTSCMSRWVYQAIWEIWNLVFFLIAVRTLLLYVNLIYRSILPWLESIPAFPIPTSLYWRCNYLLLLSSESIIFSALNLIFSYGIIIEVLLSTFVVSMWFPLILTTPYTCYHSVFALCILLNKYLLVDNMIRISNTWTICLKNLTYSSR